MSVEEGNTIDLQYTEKVFHESGDEEWKLGYKILIHVSSSGISLDTQIRLSFGLIKGHTLTGY